MSKTELLDSWIKLIVGSSTQEEFLIKYLPKCFLKFVLLVSDSYFLVECQAILSLFKEVFNISIGPPIYEGFLVIAAVIVLII